MGKEMKTVLANTKRCGKTIMEMMGVGMLWWVFNMQTGK
jgi:hypothetical protein